MASRSMTAVAPRRRRGRRTKQRSGRWAAWTRAAFEIGGFVLAALIGVIALVGDLAVWFTRGDPSARILAFAGALLLLCFAAVLLVAGWRAVRRPLARWSAWIPPAVAITAAMGAVWTLQRPEFSRQLAEVREFVGGPREAERQAIAHQVYAAYRRADRTQLTRLLDRAKVYESTIQEAAEAFGVDAEVLMGIGAAESAFYPRDSADGGRGLFQITAPPAAAVAGVRARLATTALDPLNQRHNAFLAAATLRHYLDAMRGDLFLALLAYNIGPRNGGLQIIMQQYGAHDFMTIQPYLQHLPRDYPVRVLSAALAYRIWRTTGTLLPYEDGSNAARIQQLGIPGLQPPPELRQRHSG